MASAKPPQLESTEQDDNQPNSSAQFLGRIRAIKATGAKRVTNYYESAESSPERQPNPPKRKKIDVARKPSTNCGPGRVKGRFYYESSEEEELVRKRSPARRQRVKEVDTKVTLRDRDRLGRKDYNESSESLVSTSSTQSSPDKELNLSCRDGSYELDKIPERPFHHRIGELRYSSIVEPEDSRWPCACIEGSGFPEKHCRRDESITFLKSIVASWTNNNPQLSDAQVVNATPCFLPKTPTSAPRRRKNSTRQASIDGRRQSVASGYSYSLRSGRGRNPKDQSNLSGKSKPKMAPSYRNQNRRQNRTGVIDHDVYEGIPVRQWRRENVTVAPPPTQDSTNNQNDIWAVELPHGMPKDSHLLPQHSQDLLRAARSGRIYKRPAPVEEEEADPEIILGDKPEKKEEDPKDKGFVAKAWKAVPRHLDLTDNDYLAKKRKNLVPKKPIAPVTATMTKTTVKRIDAAGNEYVQDFVVPHGQRVEGEVISQTVVPDPNAGLLAVQPTPPKRKSGTSKKKLKGPGRGRKKKPLAAPTSAPAPAADGVAQLVTSEHATGSNGVKIETDTSATPINHEDTEMGDGSMAASDDDDGDDGEDGDDGDDDEGSDIQASPAKRPRTTSPPPKEIPPFDSIPSVTQPDGIMGGTEFAGPARLFTDRERSESKLGSPLKTVALTASALTSPQVSPKFTASVEAFPAPIEASTQQIHDAKPEIANLDVEMQQEIAESAPTSLPPPPPEPTGAEVLAANETLQEEEEEEEMLLDIVDNANNAQVGAIPPADPEQQPQVVPAEPSKSLTPVEIAQQEEIVANLPKEDKISDALPTFVEAIAPEKSALGELGGVHGIPAESKPTDSKEAEPTLSEPAAVESIPSEPVSEDDDDDYPDLLGGLEKSLEKKEVKVVEPEIVNDSAQEDNKIPAGDS